MNDHEKIHGARGGINTLPIGISSMEQEGELTYSSWRVQSLSWTHTDTISQHVEVNVATKLKSVDEKP